MGRGDGIDDVMGVSKLSLGALVLRRGVKVVRNGGLFDGVGVLGTRSEEREVVKGMKVLGVEGEKVDGVLGRRKEVCGVVFGESLLRREDEGGTETKGVKFGRRREASVGTTEDEEEEAGVVGENEVEGGAGVDEKGKCVVDDGTTRGVRGELESDVMEGRVAAERGEEEGVGMNRSMGKPKKLGDWSREDKGTPELGVRNEPSSTGDGEKEGELETNRDPGDVVNCLSFSC